jgi:Bacterial SH3 domain
MNYFNGSKQDFETRYGTTGGTPVTEPFTAKVVTTGLNLRTGVGTTYPIIQQMKQDDIVKCTGNKNPAGIWWEISHVNGIAVTYPGGITTGWASSDGGNYMVVIPDTSTPTKTHDIDIYSDGSIKVDGNPYP